MKSKKTLNSSFSSMSRPSLPPNFAMKILDKEIELEKNCSPQAITELVQLYSQAIEYYNYNEDLKFYDYQSRMHKMLLKSQVMSTLSPSASVHERVKSDSSVLSAVSHKEELEKSRKLMSAELNSTLLSTSHKAERNITKAIDQNENTVKEAVVQLADNVKKQDDELLSRLESRRRNNKTFRYDYSADTSMNLSYSTPMEMIESDKSGGYRITKAELNKKIEELMEKHFSEKASKIAEINVKYEKEIIEMQEDGVLGLVVAQMRANMKQEIEAISQEYDNKRRAEIAQLKQQYQ